MFDSFFNRCIDDPYYAVLVTLAVYFVFWSLRNFYLILKEHNKEDSDGSEEIQSDIHDDGN